MNAPIKHEPITEHVWWVVDLVVFIVRKGDQDIATISERLFKLLQEQHSIFVVLNHSGMTVEQAEHLRQRFNELLLRYAQQCGCA